MQENNLIKLTKKQLIGKVCGYKGNHEHVMGLLREYKNTISFLQRRIKILEKNIEYLRGLAYAKKTSMRRIKIDNNRIKSKGVCCQKSRSDRQKRISKGGLIENG